MNYPFIEEKYDKYITRTFSEDVESHELQWHVDLEDRIVIPMNENDWLFQRDNELPIPFKEIITIKANEWHRIIKGTGNLIVKIIKKEKNEL